MNKKKVGFNESMLDEADSEAEALYKSRVKQAKEKYKEYKLGSAGRSKFKDQYKKLKKTGREQAENDVKKYHERNDRSEEEREYIVSYTVTNYEWNSGDDRKFEPNVSYSKYFWKEAGEEDKTKTVKGHSVVEVEKRVRYEFEDLGNKYRSNYNSYKGKVPEKYSTYALRDVKLK